MARRYQPGLRRPTASSWGSVSASVCSGNSSSGSASLGPFWREPIRHDRKHIKKTPQVNAGRFCRPLGARRSALSATGIPLPHVGSTGNQRSDRIPSSDPEKVGYFAAVRLRDGEFWFCRETGRFNGESFWEFLKLFREASTVSGRRVLAISDNAQYHRSTLHLSWRDQQAPQFRLDFLPPYSPELNPIERVWKLTRRLCLHNRYFGFLDGVVSAVEDQFTEWTKSNDILRRLCAIT